MRTLITQSLLSAWGYQFDCMEGYEEDAQESFMKTLRREPTEQSEAMLNGIQFENGCYALAKNPNDLSVFPQWKAVSSRIADIIRDGQIQVKVSRDLRIGDDEYLIYGICDAVKAGRIYDIKFTSKSLGSNDVTGKYIESPQHSAYLYCIPEAYKFTYLLSDGDNLYTEDYTPKTAPFIGDIIQNFRNDIRMKGLDDIYKEKWKAQ